MAKVVYEFDTQIGVYSTVGSVQIGFNSRFTDDPHPNTENVIEGFKFDESKWASDLMDNKEHTAPVLWDSEIGKVRPYLLNGVGDNLDGLVEEVVVSVESGVHIWRPHVNHGYYYEETEEYYLFSDDALTQYPTYSGLADGGTGNQITLTHDPKAGIPVQAITYKWDSDEFQWLPYKRYEKKLELDGIYTTESGQLRAQDGGTIYWDRVNTAPNQFVVDYDLTPPTVTFNKQIVEQVGEFFTTTSGLTTDELGLLDNLGTMEGNDYEEFYLTYSPVDTSMPISVFTDNNGADFQTWNQVESFSASGTNEYKLDRDLGIITFGTSTLGGKPSTGSNVRAAYFRTAAVQFEPEYTRDYVEDSDADLNPVRRYSANGYVVLRNEEIDVDRLELEAILSEISADYFGPLYLGNNVGRLLATVYSKTGGVLEGQTVFFEILASGVGTLGTDEFASAVTDKDGEAITLYSPPRTIEDMGGVTDTISTTASGTSITIDDYTPATTDEDLFLFQIAREDNILGIPKTELRTHYENFLSDGGYLLASGGGPRLDWELDALDNFAWLGSAYEDLIKWEVWHREVHGLQVPITYEDSDLRTGKKTVVAQVDPNIINPHTGSLSAVAPVFPTEFTTADGNTTVQFDVVLPEVTSSSVHKSYLIVGSQKVRFRAYTISPVTGKTIYSNEIEVLIDIPPASKGMLDIATVNSMPTGVLGNAYFFDQDGIALDPVTVLDSGQIPLGWRIRSPGITLASALDGITFLDLNPPTQSYVHDDITATVSGVTVSGMLTDLSLTFEVV